MTIGSIELLQGLVLTDCLYLQRKKKAEEKEMRRAIDADAARKAAEAAKWERERQRVIEMEELAAKVRRKEVSERAAAGRRKVAQQAQLDLGIGRYGAKAALPPIETPPRGRLAFYFCSVSGLFLV